MPDNSIILFDGYCNLCNRWVDFVIKRDPQKKFRFVAQQSPKGQQLLKERGISVSANSILLFRNQQIFNRSTAVLNILRQLQSPIKHIYYFIFIPRFIRDIIYLIIAKNRYRIFGKTEVCRLPNHLEIDRFID